MARRRLLRWRLRRRRERELPSRRPLLPKLCPEIAVRPDREREQHADEREQDRHLGRPQVERLVRDGRPDLAVEHRRDEAQHVHRGEHDRDRADDGVAPAADEDAREDEELPGERARERHRERDHADDQHQRREPRPAAAIPPSRASSPVPVRRSTEPASMKSAAEISPWFTIWSDRARPAEPGLREDADRDQPHLREARVGDDAAEVGRAEREQRPVHEPDRREDEDRRPEVVVGPGKSDDDDPQEARTPPPSTRRRRGRRRPRARPRGRRPAASRGTGRAAP